MLTLAISQPTYLPWLGYFDLMHQCDVFIFLDNVQFEKRGWQQRNKIKTSHGELLLTVPIKSKGRYKQKINETMIDTSQDFKKKHLNSIKNSYKKSKYFNDYFPEIEEIINNSTSSLVELNISLILWVAKKTFIACKTDKSSNLNSKGRKVDLLIDICKKYKATHYISAIGSKNYIDENNLFEENNIILKYQNIIHPNYNQLFKPFIPYLSTIDLLFNEGENASTIIKNLSKNF